MSRQASNLQDGGADDDDDDEDGFVDATTELTAEQRSRLPRTMARIAQSSTRDNDDDEYMLQPQPQSKAQPESQSQSQSVQPNLAQRTSITARHSTDANLRRSDIQSVTVGGQELYVDRFHVGAQTFSRRRKAGPNTPATRSETLHAPVELSLMIQTSTATEPDSSTAPLDSTATRQELLARAPVREYGADLQYWGQDEALVQPTGKPG